MKDLIGQIKIRVNEKIFIKDPDSSDLGKNIISQGLILIDEIGLENFTFKKLAQKLDTTESSIYRYFENKHKLLIYLTSWYWGWLEYLLVFSTANISSPEERFKIAIEVLTSDPKGGDMVGQINLEVLNRVVISESSKAYLTKEVDDANKEGFFAGYKRLVGRISKFVQEINPDFEYANSLISTIAEGIHHQKYFAKHLPSLTNVKNNTDKLLDFYLNMALATIKQNNGDNVQM